MCNWIHAICNTRDKWRETGKLCCHTSSQLLLWNIYVSADCLWRWHPKVFRDVIFLATQHLNSATASKTQDVLAGTLFFENALTFSLSKLHGTFQRKTSQRFSTAWALFGWQTCGSSRIPFAAKHGCGKCDRKLASFVCDNNTSHEAQDVDGPEHSVH